MEEYEAMLIGSVATFIGYGIFLLVRSGIKDTLHRYERRIVIDAKEDMVRETSYQIDKSNFRMKFCRLEDRVTYIEQKKKRKIKYSKTETQGEKS